MTVRAYRTDPVLITDADRSYDANDRLPRRAEDAHRYRRDAHALESEAHPVLDGPSDRTA